MPSTPDQSVATQIDLTTRVRAHIAILRVDHWTKNIFILPGIVVPLSVSDVPLDGALAWRLIVGTLATCIIASSNYVLNEVLDAPFDRLHPIKNTRPVASGLVNIPIAYAQWLLLLAIGIHWPRKFRGLSCGLWPRFGQWGVSTTSHRFEARMSFTSTCYPNRRTILCACLPAGTW